MQSVLIEPSDKHLPLSCLAQKRRGYCSLSQTPLQRTLAQPLQFRTISAVVSWTKPESWHTKRGPRESVAAGRMDEMEVREAGEALRSFLRPTYAPENLVKPLTPASSSRRNHAEACSAACSQTSGSDHAHGTDRVGQIH